MHGRGDSRNGSRPARSAIRYHPAETARIGRTPPGNHPPAAAREFLPFESVPWEELLAQSLEDARHTLGLPAVADSEMDSAEWSDESFFTRKFLASNVDYESVRGVKAAVAAGVPLRELMGADADTRGRVEALAREGAERDVLVGALAR